MNNDVPFRATNVVGRSAAMFLGELNADKRDHGAGNVLDFATFASDSPPLAIGSFSGLRPLAWSRASSFL